MGLYAYQSEMLRAGLDASVHGHINDSWAMYGRIWGGLNGPWREYGALAGARFRW